MNERASRSARPSRWKRIGRKRDAADTHELERRIDVLENLVMVQKRQLDDGGASAPAPSPSRTGEAIGRRAVIRTLGAAAAGAVAGSVAGASPAAAANGDPILMGQTTAGSSPTIAAVTPISTTGFAFTDDPNFTPSLPALDNSPPVAEFVGSAPNRTALYAVGTTYGVDASGSLAPLRLGAGFGDPPTVDTRQHHVGELLVNNGTLWFCSATGTPGTWRMVTGPGLSSFNPFTPTRMYDSRNSGGRISGGQTRVISLGELADRHIQGYLINLTVTDTVGAGFLTVYANDVGGVPGASSINWFTSNEIVANTTVTQADVNGLVRVTAGGTGSTHFVVDALGWYL